MGIKSPLFDNLRCDEEQSRRNLLQEPEIQLSKKAIPMLPMLRLMHFSACLAFGASLTAAFPTARQATSPNQDQFPVADGFPNPNAAQLQTISRGARGQLPNSPPPTLHPDTFKSLQLIATNEMVEVSLYEICLQKLKAGGSGFGPENFVNAEHRAFVIATFEVFYQQEEIHTLIGQGGLQANGQKTVQPSRYQLNTNTYQDCLTTANILGDNVLGVSQGVINQAIAAGDPGLVSQLDALIAQEGQQSGFLRSEMRIDGKRTRLPAAMPGYTASAREWLFSLLEQYFIQPGTDTNQIQIPVKYPMAVQNTKIQPVDQTLRFTVNLKPKTGNNAAFSGAISYPEKLYVTYMSGLTLPFSKAVQNPVVKDGKLSFSANFPAYTNIINAFALAALTPGNNYSDVQSVSDASIAGPATIELIN